MLLPADCLWYHLSIMSDISSQNIGNLNKRSRVLAILVLGSTNTSILKLYHVDIVKIMAILPYYSCFMPLGICRVISRAMWNLHRHIHVHAS